MFSGGPSTLDGGAGNDYLSAGGNSIVEGGAGDDTLAGFGSDSVLRGGAGSDRYQILSFSQNQLQIQDTGGIDTDRNTNSHTDRNSDSRAH